MPKEPFYVLEAFLAFRWVFKGDHAHIENIFWRSIIIYGRPYSKKTQYRVYSTECIVQSVQYTGGKSIRLKHH